VVFEAGAIRPEFHEPGRLGVQREGADQRAESNSRLIGAAALPNGTNAVNSLFLLDAEHKTLTLCERDAAGVCRSSATFPALHGVQWIEAIALGGGSPNCVAFMGKDAIGWIPLQGKVWEFTTLDSYETPIKDGHLNDVVSGDLNNDGRKDLVFLETAKNYLDLVILTPNASLCRRTAGRCCEERTFRSRRSDLPEPREALVTDVTGDGKNDLVILVHDRILSIPRNKAFHKLV